MEKRSVQSCVDVSGCSRSGVIITSYREIDNSESAWRATSNDLWYTVATSIVQLYGKIYYKVALYNVLL